MTEYENFSDEDLVDLLKASDGAAFSEIFKRYRSLLLLYTYRRVGDVEQAKDLIHDVFTDIWEKKESINIPKSLRPFLITIIKNKILDFYRHTKVSQNYIDNFNAYLNTFENNTDHLIRQNDLTNQIQKEVAALPEKMRVVFELSRNNHMSRKEISEYLDIPENTVRINMNRALKILKSRFGNLIILILLIIYSRV